MLFVDLPNSLHPRTSMYQLIHLFPMHLHLLIDLLIHLFLCSCIYVLIFSFINLIDLFVLWRSAPRQKHHLFFVWEGSPAIIDDTAWIVTHPLGERTGQSRTGDPDTQDTEELLTTGWGVPKPEGRSRKHGGGQRVNVEGVVFLTGGPFI